jgi:2-iminobutanoate/2-iminopropanoate deaminase
MANLEGVLGQNGAKLTDVVKTTVFLSDISLYTDMNEIYLELFGDHRPARSAMAVAGLPKGALIEIEAVAHVG